MIPSYETKFAPLDPATPPDAMGRVEGYAALFGIPDRGGDVIAPGAFAATLQSREGSVKFLWQHDAAAPIGIWDSVTEDERGLRVRGRILTTLAQGADAVTLLRAGALDGLSIGFRTVQAERRGGHRHLTQVELWEISLVTFPMAPAARLTPTQADPTEATLAAAIADAADAFR